MNGGLEAFGAAELSFSVENAAAHAETTYDVHFGLGHSFRLSEDAGVFRVSTAGLALGYHLLRNLKRLEIDGHILDMGTGSGALSLLLRDMGSRNITASDISGAAIASAAGNEKRAFDSRAIEYIHSDLFNAFALTPNATFDLIVFNPPGWRAPSEQLRHRLSASSEGLDLGAMFYGDSVAVRFLEQLPAYLRPGGRAIVGFNSLIGVSDVINRHRDLVASGATDPLLFRLLDRIEIPLLFYTPAWHEAGPHFRAEFDRWRDEHRSAWTLRDGQIYWHYEITEIRHDHGPPLASHIAHPKAQGAANRG